MINVNPLVKLALQENSINEESGLLYFISLYLNIDTKIFPDSLKAKCKDLEIAVFDEEGNIKTWITRPLMEKKDAWEWVIDWRNGFKEKVKGTSFSDRAGSIQECKKRMKVIFLENPLLRAEDAFKARDFYFTKVNNLQYLKKSHKFIYEGLGINRQSLLLQYLEALSESEEDGKEAVNLQFSRDKML